MTIRDSADELRVEIASLFAGDVVNDVRHLWKTALLDDNSRRFTIDISQIDGYDQAGYTLLREMHRHGAHIVASTPFSLVFLSEISSSRKLLTTPTPKSAKQEELSHSKESGSYVRARIYASVRGAKIAQSFLAVAD
jgi:hypothetical protein